jgi:hypothetical protein
MIEMDSNHCKIVGKSMSGEREIDEQTFASLEILGERLERLKDLDPVFDVVTFSPNICELKASKKAVTVS